ncbi:MAG: response regulator [Burkholderiales bacterium]|jgi:CheY-like chemotaxis protein|nr:response regulator [Burkholderiaceae bacterium]RTL15949.1 MAG: response regulator [Burkholderiales bacterium]|mmetsp:Transcript_37536/g.87612  ORF Transcript_37536/g.87612 Transcript_37536/m.87612 type:complete len:131 (-) Transcript_37536:1094-1486(-)
MAERAAPLVLYVEDDRIHLILMEEVFRLLPDWDLRLAETGAEALAALAETRPAVVLLDMHLPDMSGLALRQQVAADAALSLALQHTRWVALSADNPDALVRAARDSGFDDYWLKPIDVLQLKTSLHRLLD